MAPSRRIAAELCGLPLTYQTTIPEEYLDRNGHMNVAWYGTLFARSNSWVFRTLGFSREYRELHRTGCFFLESHMRYLSEVHAGEDVSLHARFVGRSTKRIHTIHFLRNDTRKVVAATCEMISGHVDMTIRRMSPFPDVVAEQFDATLSEHEALDWEPPLCGAMKA